MVSVFFQKREVQASVQRYGLPQALTEHLREGCLSGAIFVLQFHCGCWGFLDPTEGGHYYFLMVMQIDAHGLVALLGGVA